MLARTSLTYFFYYKKKDRNNFQLTSVHRANGPLKDVVIDNWRNHI